MHSFVGSLSVDETHDAARDGNDDHVDASGGEEIFTYLADMSHIRAWFIISQTSLADDATWHSISSGIPQRMECIYGNL